MYVLITKRGCTFCEKAKNHLATEATPFLEIDVTDNQPARDALRQLGHRTVPVVVPLDQATDYEGLISARSD